MKRAIPLSFVLAAAGLCSCVDTPAEPEDVGEAQEPLVTTCPYLDPSLHPIGDPLLVPVDYHRELVITDLGVIDDQCRTTWTKGGACPGTRGVWTFGTLMTRMAGTVAPSLFVADWLHSFQVANTVNGFPVPARPGMDAAIINGWIAASGCAPGPVLGCALDLHKAPFRLLGIINRSDLSGPGFGAATKRGQTRFVFGAVNGDPDVGPSLPFTVIFEYDDPSQLGGTPRTDFDWITDYHTLSDAGATGVLGAPLYNARLQAITDPITSPGAEPGDPNFGAAIATVRTNEIAFGGTFWKMREYQLKTTGAGINAYRLRLDPLDQTPDDSLNGTAGLDTYLFPNSLAFAPPNHSLLDFTFTVPVPGLQGGESSAPLPGPTPYWNHLATPLVPLERHQFGLATCDGCHKMETNTNFVHLAPRNAGAPTVLSPFLSTSPAPAAGGVPAAVQLVADAAPTGATFQYNEPWRRVCEETRILKGVPDPWSRGNGGH